MPGASLSRWTLSYFGAALLMLLLAEALMALGFGYPAQAIDAPETLVVVHIVAIGWLSLLMAGALFQFVPVLVGKPLWGERLAIAALVLLLGGLGLLVTGFAAMGNLLAAPLEVLPLGALLLAAGFGCIVIALGRTIWMARPLALPALFVVAGLMALVATVLLGSSFAGVLSGLSGGDVALDLLLHGVPVHAILGLCGWMSFTAMGVSYRLLSMFMLAPESPPRTVLLAFGLGALALLLAAAVVPFALAASGGAGLLLAGAAVFGLGALLVYGGDVAKLYRLRKRRRLELNALAATGALASLLVASVLLAVLLGLGQVTAQAGALVYLFAFGWLGGLGLAMLYKIVPFVTWLECFAPLLGKRPTPRVQDLVDEARAAPWFGLYFFATAAATVTLLIGAPAFFQGLAGLQLAATLAIAFHLYRSRTLRNVPAETRDGFAIPHLILPHIVPRRPL